MTDSGNRRIESTVIARMARKAKDHVFVFVFLPVLLIYLSTATYGHPWHIDPATNAITAWYLGNTGSPILTEHGAAATAEQLGNIGWIVPSPRGAVSQYPPGAAALAAPLYALWDGPMVVVEIRGQNRPDLDPVEFPLPPLAPAAITAAVSTALAAGLVALATRSTGQKPLLAVSTGWVAALATGYWSVSSNQLWQHGPASAAVAAATLALLKGRRVLAGAAFGCAILIRPHLAIIAAVCGIGLALTERRTRPLLQIGAPSAIGLGGLLAYNWWIWGSLTISGGYGSDFSEAFVSNGFGWYLLNVVGALVDWRHGLFVASPFLLFLIPGIRKAWRDSSPTVKLSTLGGVVYLLVQLRANRFSGGDGHFGYRYPLEALTVAAPLLASAYLHWAAQTSRRCRYFAFAVVLSIVPQLIWAVLK